VKLCVCLQGGQLPSGESTVQGFSLTLEQVDRHQAGVYQCLASNGVGQSATFDTTLHVLCEYNITLTFQVAYRRGSGKKT
jgi:hypothetical protein